MPWLLRAVQESGPWKGWGHSQSLWGTPLEPPPARIGFALQNTSLGKGIHWSKLAFSHPALHLSWGQEC